MNAERRFAVEVVRTLQEQGWVAYLAGGCVRDEILGRIPNDYDVATSATPAAVRTVFPRTVAVGAHFGVVVVLGGKGLEVEVATFRTDGAYRDGRHPETVTFGDAKGDAERRDFTINGLFLDPVRDEVIDHVGGLADLDRRIVRSIGSARQRFEEDKLRLLRAVRLCADLNFDLDPKTAEAIREHSGQIGQVSAERQGDELRKILVGPDPARALRDLADLRLLEILLPEFAAEEPPGDNASSSALERSCKLLSLMAPADPAFRWAVLLKGLVTGGPESGSPSPGTIVRAISDRFRFSNQQTDRIRYLLEASDAVPRVPGMREAERRRYLAVPGVEQAIELHRIVERAGTGGSPAADAATGALEALGDRRDLPEPLVDGNDLIALGLTPGRSFQTILTEIQDLQLDGVLEDRDAALAHVRRHYLR